MRKIARFLFSIYGFALFLTLMILLLPLFLFSFLMGKIKGGNILFAICRFWADTFFLLTGIRHKNIYEEPHDSTRQYIFISNHISYLDIPMMIASIRHQHIRILGKSEMAKVPIFGFIYRQGAVLVNRENARGRAKSVENLISFLQKKISVFICPEGTFNVTDQPLQSFYDGAFRIAIETQEPIRPILFLDTYDRLNYKTIFSLNPGICRAVYLPAIETEGLTMKDMSSLKDRAFNQMAEALINYQVSWIKAPVHGEKVL